MIALIRAIQEPVSSWGTYHAAYTLVAIVYAGYATSLWLRARRYRDAVRRGKPTTGA